MTPAAPSGLISSQRYGAVLALSLGTGMLVVDNSIATVALPTIAESLAIPASSAVVIVTVYQVAMLMALLPFSALGDLVGHRRLYQTGQLVFLIASVGSALATNLPMLLAARCFQALGVAAALSVSSALLRATYPALTLGRGMAFNSLIIAVAGAAAPSLGGFILAAGSWRWVFAAAAPFAILSLLLGRAIPAPRPHSSTFDIRGALLCAAMFGLLMSGIASLLHHGGWIGVGLLVSGIVVAVLFVRRELGSARPILPVDLLARPAFALPTAATLFAFSASMAFMIALPFRLQAGGATPAAIGLVLAVWPVAMMVAAPLAGFASDRAPKGLPGAVGMVLAAIGLALAGLIPTDSPFTILALPMVLGGIGFGLFISPNAHLIVGAAPHDRAASAGALVSATRFIGQALGAALAAAMLATFMGKGSMPAFIAAALALASAGFSLAHLMRGLRTGRGVSDTLPYPPS